MLLDADGISLKFDSNAQNKITSKAAPNLRPN